MVSTGYDLFVILTSFTCEPISKNLKISISSFFSKNVLFLFYKTLISQLLETNTQGPGARFCRFTYICEGDRSSRGVK